MFQRDLNFIHKYFIAEKQESLLFLIVGIVAIGLAIVFFFFIKSNPSFYKGMAWPLLVVGLIQVVVGYTVYARSDIQRQDVSYKMGLEPKRFIQEEEGPRMKKVMVNFVYYRYVEIGLVIAGLVLVFLYRNRPEREFWFGLGITLALQAIIMLGADYFAEKRGAAYVSEMGKLI